MQRHESGPIATTMLGIYLHYNMQTRKIDTPHAFSTTFGLLCGLQALTALAALRLPLRAAHREKPAEAAEVRVEAAEALGE